MNTQTSNDNFSTAKLHSKPILITPGEPAGIGPDIVIQTAQQGFDYPTIIIADPELLQQRAQQLQLPIAIQEISNLADEIEDKKQTLYVYPVKLAAAVKPGILNIENAKYVINTIDTAMAACLDKTAAAMVTGPVHKAIINQAGIAFRGHTQYLAEQTQSDVVMFFISEKLCLALVTDHIPLYKVATAITIDKLTSVLKTLHKALQDNLYIQDPIITVCGLNPHAGENGILGDEEQQVIIPVIETLTQQGLKLIGPVSADSLFATLSQQHSDAVVAMYHDQGLPILKYLSFGQSANVTLGLPFIRTSVDHGTALSLAGTGNADASSMRYVLSVTQRLIYATAT